MADEISIVVKAEDSFSGILGNFGNIMTGIQSTLNIAGQAMRAFGGFAMEGLNAIAGYERMEASLQSLTASQILQAGAAEDMASAMAMAAPKAEELLGWIQEIAIKSPFTSEGVAQAFRMAEAYGFSADESKRLVQALIDFTAGTGASEYAMQQIARALGQISATGRVTGGDMLQLVNAGLPVTQILADGFGVTTAKIMEMREKGLLPAKESIEMITDYLETNFKGAAEAQANTWAGLQGTFADLKTMGLREFFGGLFEVLQPLAVTFAEWIQSSGLDRLREWGTAMGEFAQNAINFISPLVDVFSSDTNIGTKIDIFFATIFDTMSAYIDDWISGGGAEELSNKIISFLGQIGQGSEVNSRALFAMQTLINALGDAVSRIDWSWIMGALDRAISRMIENHDWAASGEAFGKMIGNLFDDIGSGNLNSDALNSLADGISDFFLGAVGVTDWGEFKSTFMNIINQNVFEPIGNWFKENWWKLFLPTLPSAAQRAEVGNIFKSIASDVTSGFTDGINQFNLNAQAWVNEHIVNPVKRALGIASPSSVFMQIGMDIVNGLIMGFGSMIGSLFTVINTIVNSVLDLFQPVLDVLGFGSDGTIGVSGSVNSSSGLGAGTGGSVGGHSTTGGATGTNGRVVNNFYGPVYIGTNADLDNANYDCPSPHPLMTASSQTLLTNTIG